MSKQTVSDQSRIVGDPKAQFSRAHYDAQIDYIADTPAVRDVLISGGDPLVLPQHILEDLLRRLRVIPHEEGQEGVAELLAGRRLAIVPKGFEQVHHRLTRIQWHAVKQALTEKEEDK